MKSNRIQFRLMTIVALMTWSLSCAAQSPFAKYLNKLPQIPVTSVPFEGVKSGLYYQWYSYPLDNNSGTIPDRLYFNLQRTQYKHAEISSEDGPWNRVGNIFRKFTLPGSNNVLFIVDCEESEWSSEALCVVNPTSGALLDTLEVEVLCYTGGVIATKQFRITAQNQIIVSTITPVAATPSLSFETFTSFTGQRVDRTYVVDAQGHFVQTSVQYFQPQTYTRAYLADKYNDIWEGSETPL